MKQYIKRLVSFSLAIMSLAAVNMCISAQPETSNIVQPQKTSFVGLIESTRTTSLLFGGKESVSATVVTEDGQRIILNINKNTVLAEQSTTEPVKAKRLEDGQMIFVAHAINAPVTSSEPPELSPQIVVILSETSHNKIKFDTFDENGLSSDGSLRITLTEETKITTKHNKPVEINKTIGKELLVFFKDITLPGQGEAPQTIPERVIVVGKAER